MKKLLVLAVFVVVILLAGCAILGTQRKNNVVYNAQKAPATIQTSEEPDQSDTLQMHKTPVPVSDPTLEPTPEPLYVPVLVDWETSAEEFGWYSLMWKLQPFSNGKTFEEAYEELYAVAQPIKETCGYSDLYIGKGIYYLSNEFRWDEYAMDGPCWDLLEQVVGTKLERNDPTLDDPRIVECTADTDCSVLSTQQINTIKEDMADYSSILRDPSGNFYSIKETWSRITPNIFGYSGMGNSRFLYPTEVLVPNPGQISQMGIVNWGGATLCYNAPGWVSSGEMGVSVPGHQKCVKSDEFPRAGDIEELEVAEWNFTSQTMEGDLLLTWDWIPTLENGLLKLNIIEVAAVQLFPADRPEKIIRDAGEVKYFSADQYQWVPGEYYTVTGIDTAYYEVDTSNTSWNGYIQIFLGMTLEGLAGDKRYISEGYHVNFDCYKDGSFRCSAGDWYSHEEIEIGDRLLVTDYDETSSVYPLEFNVIISE